MKPAIYAAFCSLLLLSTLNAHAHNWENTTATSVGTIEIYEDRITVFTTTNMCGPTATNRTYPVIKVGMLGVTKDNFDKMYTALVAARLAGRQVIMFTQTANSTCYIGAVQL